MPTLNWIGKEAVINHHDEVPIHTLTHDQDRSLTKDLTMLTSTIQSVKFVMSSLCRRYGKDGIVRLPTFSVLSLK